MTSHALLLPVLSAAAELSEGSGLELERPEKLEKALSYQGPYDRGESAVCFYLGVAEASCLLHLFQSLFQDNAEDYKNFLAKGDPRAMPFSLPVAWMFLFGAMHLFRIQFYRLLETAASYALHLTSLLETWEHFHRLNLSRCCSGTQLPFQMAQHCSVGKKQSTEKTGFYQAFALVNYAGWVLWEQDVNQ